MLCGTPESFALQPFGEGLGRSHFLAFLGDISWFCYSDLGEIEIPVVWQDEELPEHAMTSTGLSPEISI